MDGIVITDVSLRDGLQNQSVPVSTPAKIELGGMLVGAGLNSLEVTSFVSPRAVPQMADAHEVVQGLSAVASRCRLSALVPNLVGLGRAVQAGAPEIAVVLAATETMNLKNIGLTLTEATRMCEETLQQARRVGIRTRAYLAVAFDCPFEGPVSLSRVLGLAAQLGDAGADELVVADTIGSAAPGQVKRRLHALAGELPLSTLGVHFHDTRGMGVANAWAALECGVRRFDASIGGIGGCPFAPGAAGNLATEDLVLMAECSGLRSGIELDKLMNAVAFAEAQLGRALGGRCAPWLRSQSQKKAAAIP